MRLQKPPSLEEIDTLPGYRIRVSEESCLVLIDERPLRCRPGEYRVLVALLRSPDRAVPFARLLAEGYDPRDWLARQSLRRLMSRLRPRLWPFGLHIRCLLGQGYVLFAGDEDEA